MKQLLVIGILSFYGLFSNGQVDRFNLKLNQKNLAKINDSIYFSYYEVTNGQYSIFLKQLIDEKKVTEYQSAQIDTSKWKDITAYDTKVLEYQSAQIDTSIWIDSTVYDEFIVKYYHTHPAYANYPVVNLSFEGATLYCAWLTDQYNSDDKRAFKKVKIRLPTREEWIEAAKGGNPDAVYPWNSNEIMTKKGKFRCNFIGCRDTANGCARLLNDNAEYIVPSKWYRPNRYGLFNMSGNVAEMITEKGKTMGGSWLDNADAMKIDSLGKYETYNTPMPTIGFRFVMVVIEK